MENVWRADLEVLTLWATQLLEIEVKHSGNARYNVLCVQNTKSQDTMTT